MVDPNNKFRATIAASAGSNSIPITATDGSGNTTSKTATVTLNGTVATPAYDVRGDLTFDGTKTYTYDGINELVSIAYAGTTNTTQMSYDALGRRIQIVEKTGSTVTSTKNFVWIGNTVAEERDASNTVTKRFFSEGEQIGGVGYLFNKDHLGSIREMMDSTGAIRARYSYDPYGQRTKISGDLDADFGFTGDYYHAPSSLCFTLYRAYDPNFGRWLSRDPLEDAEMLEGPNLYAYVQNNPINLWDPSGLLCFDFDQFSDDIEKNRFDLGATLGALGTTLGVGTMPKTPGELRGFGVPKSELNPYTSQLSRWSGRTGNRALRLAGRSAAGVALGAVATAATIFEGFYDWGVIAAAAFHATSRGDCPKK